jgi:hypothetical protein
MMHLAQTHTAILCTVVWMNMFVPTYALRVRQAGHVPLVTTHLSRIALHLWWNMVLAAVRFDS